MSEVGEERGYSSVPISESLLSAERPFVSRQK